MSRGHTIIGQELVLKCRIDCGGYFILKWTTPSGQVITSVRAAFCIYY